MSKDRLVIITIWVAICLMAAFFVWKIATDQSAGETNVTNGGAIEQPSAAPPASSRSSPAETDDHDLSIDEEFRSRVLSYYEIAATEDRSRRDKLLPTVATEHYLKSYHGNARLDNPAVTTVVDRRRSEVHHEDDHDRDDVRFVISTIHVIKTDQETGEIYEYTITNDHTTWVLIDGEWMVDGQTVFIR